jgi:DNA-directed RNA polymerase specialized sigma24 family protein
LKWADVARHMDRSEGAVQMLWFRALKKLRPLLEEKR